MTARDHQISYGVLEAEARATSDRELRIIAENVAREKAIIVEMLAPTPGAVSVYEIEAYQAMLDDDSAKFCELFARMRRQLKATVDAVQGLSDVRERMEVLEAWQERAKETLSRLSAWEHV